MGKIVKNGFDFVAYANAGLIRKVDDIPELKERLITLSEPKTHVEMSRYAVLLGEHILSVSGIERSAAIEECLVINAKWQNKEAKFQAARDAAGVMHRLAREEKSPLKAKTLRAMGQVAVTPHVKWHALVASEYAVVIINLLCPGDMAAVRKERETQIELLNRV
ncbi:MAG: hypothetical protein LBK98_11785 [Peptococcaceae bacterium]|jgi:hypothetical protein|nr:hypothetical protein [Peptococcaceae bacterium]